jgi:peptide/nickel transport system permease protein
VRRYVVARLAQSALVVLLSLSAVFGMVRLGGDPVLLFLPMDIQAKDVEAIRQQMGFNDPVLVQYVRYMRGALHGDFGESLRYRRDALGLVLERLPATLLLAGSAILLTLVIAVPLGVVTAVRRDTLVDHLGTIATVLGQATPGFWLGLLLIYVFAVQLRWLPTGGWPSSSGDWNSWILPVITLALGPSALVARYTRASLVDVLRADYIRTARAKGLPQRRVVLGHALKNALIPLITILAPQIPSLITGTIFVEVIFRVPGLGKFFVSSIYLRDYPMIMATMLLVAVLWSITYLLSDILYTVVDPRIRLS